MSRSPQKNYLDRLLTPEGAPEQEERENAQRASSPLGSPLLTPSEHARAHWIRRVEAGSPASGLIRSGAGSGPVTGETMQRSITTDAKISSIR